MGCRGLSLGSGGAGGCLGVQGVEYGGAGASLGVKWVGSGVQWVIQGCQG